MLKLRRGTVLRAGDPRLPMQPLEVEVAGAVRPAIADVALVGSAREGDEIVVNVQARDLGLGSGGFDIVHVNLTRGLEGRGTAKAHVMKLNYTALQHAVLPVETADLRLPLSAPVAVISLHGHLAPLAWAFAQAAPGCSLGYVQTPGGALPGALSHVVGELRRRGLLATHVSAGHCYGGEQEAITLPGALHHGIGFQAWGAAVCGPGPGILGSASALGHGGMQALDSAHAALALGAPTLVVPRMSSADRRERHRGFSHHTLTVLRLLLRPVIVPVPAEVEVDERCRGEHDWRPAAADLEGYAASGLPTSTMGRDIAEDPLFFAAPLAAGRVLAAALA